MKRKAGFVTREVAGKTVAVAVGEKAQAFHGMITLNGTAAFLWGALAEETTEETLVKRLTEAYEVTEDAARADIKAFLQNLRQTGLLDE